MPKTINVANTKASKPSSEFPSQVATESQKSAFSRIAWSLGVAMLAIGYAGIRSLQQPKGIPSISSHTDSPYPPGILAQYLPNGTFGAPLEDGLRLDGVMVCRGDKTSHVIQDPYNKDGGIILSDRARKIFDRLSHNPKYASPEGQFKLAVLAAKRTREKFMNLPVNGMHGQNDLASIQLANSRAVKGGSPFLSLTLNHFTAGYFALGGQDNTGHSSPVNLDGRVFLSRVNNATTVYPVVGGKTKGVKIGFDPRPISDKGMVLSSKLKVPIAELLIVGGYYFYDSVSTNQALTQNPDTFRKIPDLYKSSLSFQMVEPINGSVEFLSFQHHFPRILKSLENDA
jgi:hypothetical protein